MIVNITKPPIRQQSITWTNADPFHQRIYVALGEWGGGGGGGVKEYLPIKFNQIDPFEVHSIKFHLSKNLNNHGEGRLRVSFWEVHLELINTAAHKGMLGKVLQWS